MAQIAREAKVHVTTVSLALRSHPSIPLVTRDRIQTIARSLGYRPDPVLSSLVAYRQGMKPASKAASIAYLTAGPSREQWRTEPALVEIYRGASQRADQHGYRLEEFWVHEPGITPRRWSQIFLARGIESILIAPWQRGHGHLRMPWERFHCVKIGYPLLLPKVHTVENHHYQSMVTALRRLRRKGYRRIGFYCTTMDNERLNNLYKAAYLIDQERCKRNEKVPILTQSNWNQSLFSKWYQRYRPEVVVCSDQPVFQWLKDMGLSVPEDVGYARLGCPGDESFFSGTNEPTVEVGAVAMDTLITTIHRNERGIPAIAHTILVDCRWVEGETTRSMV